MALVTGHLDPDSSCQGQFVAYRFLSFVSSLMRRIRHSRCPVSTFPAQTYLRQPYTRHSVLIGHLPHIPNAGTMYEVLGKALPDKSFGSG
jgi:hypothetical protein